MALLTESYIASPPLRLEQAKRRSHICLVFAHIVEMTLLLCDMFHILNFGIIHTQSQSAHLLTPKSLLEVAKWERIEFNYWNLYTYIIILCQLCLVERISFIRGASSMRVNVRDLMLDYFWHYTWWPVGKGVKFVLWEIPFAYSSRCNYWDITITQICRKCATVFKCVRESYSSIYDMCMIDKCIDLHIWMGFANCAT